MKKKIIITVSVVALLITGTIFAFAAQHRLGPHRFAGRAMGSNPEKFIEHALNRAALILDLTDEQKTKIQAILAAEKPVVQPLVQQLAAYRQELKQVTNEGQFNEAQIQAIAAKQGQTLSQLIVEKERVKAQIYTVLTPEQRAKAEKMRDQFMERVQEHFTK